jgi:restriction system protein
MGYGIAQERICHIKDGGIDGIIYTDELRIKDKIYIQAKRYSDGNNVAIKDVKEFLYNVKEAKCRGVFITTSKFSKDAELEVKKAIENGAQIACIDDKNLIKHLSGMEMGKRIDL